MMRETRIETGAVRGIACGWPSITVFYGIPYAAPPVGELRWRPPESAEGWEGVKDCARPGPRCPQMGVGKGSFYEKEFYPVEETMDEDCLYLNVWTPAQSANERLPVIFWVHGGAFLTGYGHSAHFDGEHFARQGVILVTINYRLNIFGWMASPELAAESERHTSGNYGLLDQIFALEWTRRNITAFGGDPDNITIAGQSAGAMCIQALLTTPLTKGLMTKAILQSGGGITPVADMRFPALVEAQERTDLSLLGVKSIAEARRLSWRELLDRWSPYMFDPRITRTPVIDGWVLPASLDDMAHAGNYSQVPCLIGYTAREGIPAARNFKQWKDLLVGEYGQEMAEQVAVMAGGEERFEEYSRVDHFTKHLRAAAESWAVLSEKQNAAPVYVYCLDRELPGDNTGSFHAADLWYVFKTLMRSWRPWEQEDYWLAYACNAYWAGFAKTGVPQGDRLPQWKPYTTQNPMTMVLGANIDMIRLEEDPLVNFRKEILSRENVMTALL